MLFEVRTLVLYKNMNSAPFVAALVLLGIIQHAQASSTPLDVSYVSTPHKVVHRMLEMADLQADDYLIDLGSGDGRIPIAAARDWGVRNALGIELDPDLVAESKDNAREAGVADYARFEVGNLYETDFSDATVLAMYLLPTINLDLRPVILEKMTPGTRVVSHAFDMRGWQPDEYDSVEGSHIFMWIVPAHIDGHWQILTSDEDMILLSLDQSFQEFDGTAVFNDRTIELTGTELRGDKIRFYIGPDLYVGVIDGDEIDPLEEGNAVQDWQARRN